MHWYLMLVDDDDDDDDVRYTGGVCQFRLFQDIVSLCNKISRCRSKVQQLIPFGNVVNVFILLFSSCCTTCEFMYGVVAALETQSTQKLRPQNTASSNIYSWLNARHGIGLKGSRTLSSQHSFYKFWRDENFM